MDNSHVWPLILLKGPPPPPAFLDTAFTFRTLNTGTEEKPVEK